MLVPAVEPDPVAGPGQVLVEVSVAGLTFVETQIRQGVGSWHRRPELPYVPGGLVGGTVRELGSRVDPSWAGRRVVARIGETGGFAELAVAEPGQLFAVPDALGLQEAVALYTDGSTAQGLVEHAGITPGDRVLIEAAAGGVGSLLIQLCRLAGAQVIAAARGSRKLDLTRTLGAHASVDYSTPDWSGQVRQITAGTGPDVVFDGVGGPIGRSAFEMTAPQGRFSIHGAASGELTRISPDEAARRDVTVISIDQLAGFRPHVPRWAEQIMAQAISGDVVPVIGQTFPLERASEAHAAIENRTALGKTLVIVR
ncbi:NADPH:quinone reductase [Kineosporia sp. NBRC 101731]|nr:NADPH:quinone reductase [Kineosporia sp. NBRC 101731]